MNSLRGALALALAVALAAPTAVHAADPQPYKVEMGSAGEGTLNSTLKATSELQSLRTTAPVGPYGLIGRARADVDRLKTVLESFGFYQGSVLITIDGLALDDSGLGEELTSRPKGSDARVKITFATGPLYHLRNVVIDGEVPQTAANALGLTAGAPAVASDVLAGGDRLLTALQDQGYAFAKVDLPVAREDPANRVLDVSFHAVTGARVMIGEIRLRGLARMREAYVRKRLLVHTGEQYGATKLEAARKDLLGLGVFSTVTVRVATAPDSDGRVPITFQVRERPLHAVAVNAAYSSDLGGSTGVNWSYRDISGRADTLTLSATALNLGGGTATNGIGYDMNGKYVLPDFGRRDQSLQVALSALKQSLVAYDQTAVTAGVTLNRKLSSIWSISAGVTVEEEHIVQQECAAPMTSDSLPQEYCVSSSAGVCVPAPEPLPPGQTVLPPDLCTFQNFHYTLLGLPLTVLLNTTGLDSPLEDARKGVRLSVGVTPTLSIGRPNTRFFITQASASTYFDLENLGLHTGPGRSVLALRALGGLAGAATEFSLPPDQRFYAGGSGTIRGFRYQSVGPEFPDGNPIGGTAINAGTIEYRQRIGTNFGTAVFVDGGKVSKNLDPFNGSLRFGTGVGVRYYTPIGPIRLDLAVPIARRHTTTMDGVTVQGDDAFEIYIGLGQAF